MKRFCKLFALLLALTLMLTACGGNAAPDGDSTDSAADTPAADEPMMALGSGLSLMSASRYAGAFVEDGSDETVADVLAITVRNDGDKTVQYAHITLTLGESAYEFETEPSLCADVLGIETQDTAITVTNNSGSDMGQIYVYYKIAYGDLYLGGITYRVGVSGLKAGESTTCYAGHFSTEYSKLMFATYVQ